MGRKKRIAIVGLPRFAEKLAKNLRQYRANLEIRHLNTYGSATAQLKSIPFLLRCDTVYSINGSIGKSNVFDLALRLNKKLVMHWVGTDVVRAIKAYKSGNYFQKFIDRAEHLCEVEWMREELTEIGIQADIQNFVAFEKDIEVAPRPSSFNILSYLHPDREEFYGINDLIKCARAFPDVPFYLAGTSGYGNETPANMHFLGWINNMDEMIEKAGLCVRIPEHDGLSSFVLESLAKGKFVAYTYEYPHCISCKSGDQLIEIVREKKKLYESGTSYENPGAVEFISREFQKEVIYDTLLQRLTAP